MAWGCNSDKQLDVPKVDKKFIAVSAGHNHSLGILDDGTCVVWGKPGILLNLPKVDKRFIAISAGLSHSLGLLEDDSCVAWGYNYFDQLEIPK